MPELATYVIDLVEEVELLANEEAKISSSNKRKRLLGTVIREPQVRL